MRLMISKTKSKSKIKTKTKAKTAKKNPPERRLGAA